MDRRHRHRAELEVYNVVGMFQQAAVSFKASIPLFLTLALISAVYEMAVERSALLSGISFSAQSSNFSFQFALDPKTQAGQTSHDALNSGRLQKFDTADSLLSRLLTAILPPDDHDVQSTGIKEQEPKTSTEAGSNVGDITDKEMLPTFSGIEEGDGMQSQESFRPEGVNDGEHSYSFNENLQPIVHKKEDSSSISGQNVVYDAIVKSEISQDATYDNQYLNKDGDVATDIDFQNGVTGEKVAMASGYMKSEMNLVQGGKESDEDEDVFEKDEDVTDGLPRLKIESVSNETKEVVQETVIDAIDLTFFTGKLLGGRGLDQGAMPHGGMTMLLIFLLVALAVTLFLAIVGFQHAAVLGSVAYSVVCTHMGKRASATQAIKSSLKSSIGRLMWLAILHATLRGLQSLFFMKTLFGGVMEMEQVEQLVLRLSATPFAFLAPFMDVDASSFGMAVRIGLFVLVDYLLDGISYCIYVIACWVTIMERDFWGLGAVSRSFNLVKGMERQALLIRLVEATICGRTARWLLQQTIRHYAAAFVICIAQVFFLVVWLIFYMSARSLHDRPLHFSYQILEDFLDRFK